MAKIQMIFTNSRTIMSPLIRLFTWSDFSHVAVIFNENKIIHSDFKGTRIELLSDLQKRSKNWMIVEYDCINPDLIIQQMMTQLGKKYDFTGIIGILFRQVNWQHNDKFWCSEYPEYGFCKAGEPKFATEFATRIVPQHWLMLPHKKIAFNTN